MRVTDRTPHRPQLFETLEVRTLLSFTALPFADPTAAVYDAQRSLLYVLTADRTLHRYDANAGQPLESWPLGFTPGAADIAPDGSSLYVNGREPGGNRMGIFRIDLDTGAIDANTFDVETGTMLSTALVVSAGGDVVFDLPDAGGGTTKLRRFDPETQTLSSAFNSPGGPRSYDVGRPVLLRTPDGNRVVLSQHVMNTTTYTATSFDADLNVLSERPGMSEPLDAISPDGSTVATGLALYDASSFAPRLTLSVVPGQSTPDGAAFDATRPLLYRAAHHGSEYLDAFDVNTGALRGSELINYPFFIPERVIPPADRDLVFVYGLDGVLAVRLGPTPSLEGLPRYVRAGVEYPVTVTARHPSLGIDTEYSGTVHFTSGDASAALPVDYTFTAADAGTHTFPFVFNTAGPVSLTVTEVGGVQGSATLGPVDVDAQSPIARLQFTTDPADKNAPRYLGVEYQDDISMEVEPTTADDDLFVVAPDGRRLPVRASEAPLGSRPQTRRYAVDAPGGTWDQADNGTYTVHLAGDSVRDLAGNPVAGGELTTFTVNLDKKGFAIPAGQGPRVTATVAAAPPRAIGGTTARTTLLLQNAGDQPVDQAVSVDLVLRSEASGFTDGTLVARVEQHVNLPPGRSQRVKVNVELPRGLPGGTYRLVPLASDDGGAAVGGVVSAGPAGASRPLRVTEAKPDLRSYDPKRTFTVTPQTSTVRAAFRVRNVGNSPGGGTYLFQVKAVRLNRDDFDELGPVTFTMGEQALNLGPGQQTTLTFDIDMSAQFFGRYAFSLAPIPRNLNDDLITGTPVND
jgi:hypothetical protein